MPMIRRLPCAPLRAHVERLWWSRRDEPELRSECMLPSGAAQLIFALHDDAFTITDGSAQRPQVWSGGILHGPQRRFFVSGPKPKGAIVGVAFRAGAAGAFLGVPGPELTDRHVSVDDLWGVRGCGLRERLREARDPQAALDLLESELLAHLERGRGIHPAVAHALSVCATGGIRVRVADVQRASGYSARHFIALFQAAVGLTPKHYFRIQRFAAALRGMAPGDARIAEIAAEAGYADQSHLTREFRDFAGISPTEYRPRSSGSIFHHRMPEHGKAMPVVARAATAGGKRPRTRRR